MNNSLATFIVVFYVVIWIFTALSYEDEEGQGTWYVWVVCFFWPIITILKLMKGK